MDQCTKVRSQQARLKVIVQGKGHRPPSLSGAKEHAGKFFGVAMVSEGGRTQGHICPQAVPELTMKPRMTLSF